MWPIIPAIPRVSSVIAAIFSRVITRRSALSAIRRPAPVTARVSHSRRAAVRRSLQPSFRTTHTRTLSRGTIRRTAAFQAAVDARRDPGAAARKFPAHFVNAGFSPAAFPADDPPPQYNNCAICHQTLPRNAEIRQPRGRRAAQALAEASADSFVPGAAFFKSSPDSHASCFSCHYQGQKPVSTDCAGCHRPAAPYLASDVITRYSLKYDHETPAYHAIKDCTTCHVRITQNSDLSTMKDADVPFMTCAACHDKDLKKEMDKRTESIAAKQPVFQCAYCHVSEIGRFEIPASHRLP